MFWQISQNSQKEPVLESCFKWNCRSAASSFIKKDTGVWHRCFLVNFWEISQNTVFIEPLWTAFCLITHSVYCPTTTSRFIYISLNSGLRTILLWGMRSWRSKDFFVKDFLQLTFFLTWHRCTIILTFSKNITLYFYTAKF